MFRAADLVLLSKSDLLPVLDDFQPDNARRHLRDLASSAPVFELSAKNAAGMDTWIHWLLAELARLEHQSGRLAAEPA
jgi:hydrogenase nickel incorporation protein HypB